MMLRHTIVLSFCFHVFAFAAASLFSTTNDLTAEVFPTSYEVQFQHQEAEKRVKARQPQVNPVVPSAEAALTAESATSESLSSSRDLPANRPGPQSTNTPNLFTVNLSGGILHPYLVDLRQKVFFKLNSISELDMSKSISITFLVDKAGSIRDLKIKTNSLNSAKAENDVLTETFSENSKSRQNNDKIAAVLMRIKSLGALPAEISENPIWVHLVIHN